jgi:hypothetical protein
MFESTEQLANPLANKSQPKLTQFTADGKNDPSCYACIPCTSIKCSNSHTAVPFGKSANFKSETLAPGEGI